MTYDIDYDDQRFAKVESDKQEALTKMEEAMGGMLEESDAVYESQMEASKDWAQQQAQLQQEKTDQAIAQTQQQKAQAEADYIKEQSASYADFQKQTQTHGVNAEAQAAGGFTGSGYSESTRAQFYNAYQNRLAQARESFNQAVTAYNTAITEARLQNSSILAQIAFDALQQQMELTLQNLRYRNELRLDQANQLAQLEQDYYQRGQDVLEQMNKENSLALELEKFAFQQQKYADSQKKRGSGGKKKEEKEEEAAGYTPADKIALGYGPITDEKFNALIESGEVKVMEDGTLLPPPTPTTNPFTDRDMTLRS